MSSSAMNKGAGSTSVEDDLNLPKGTVERVIIESLPEPMQRSKEFIELVMACCLEFLTLLSTASQDFCDQGNKKIMMPEHVLQAIQDLGFSDYLIELHDLTSDVKVTSAKEREKKNARFNKHGMTDEELLAKQAELFAQAQQQATGLGDVRSEQDDKPQETKTEPSNDAKPETATHSHPSTHARPNSGHTGKQAN